MTCRMSPRAELSTQPVEASAGAAGSRNEIAPITRVPREAYGRMRRCLTVFTGFSFGAAKRESV